jgi:hypothetical protein
MKFLNRLFIISSIFLTILLVLWGIYNLSFRSPNKETPPENGNKEEPKNPVENPLLPKNNSSKIKQISDEAVVSPVLSPSGNTIKYYSKQTGKVYQIDLEGENKKTISEKEVANITGAAWSPDQTKSIVKKLKPDGLFDFVFYNYLENNEVPLKPNVDEVSWEKNGIKIFYKYYDSKTKKRALYISTPTGDEPKELSEISYKDISIAQIPKTGIVSFWNQGDANTQTSFESIPVIGGEKKSIYQDKFGADYLWDSDGNNALVSHVDEKGGKKMTIALINSSGGEYRNLFIPTFASKCLWSKNNKILYYALPGNIPDQTVLPNDYREERFRTTDTFWKMDLAKGDRARIVEPENIYDKFDATNLFLDDSETSLFFVNKADGKLYKINLQ